LGGGAALFASGALSTVALAKVDATAVIASRNCGAGGTFAITEKEKEK